MGLNDTASERPGADGLPTTGELVDGRFRIRGLLGMGGMGAVYSAHDQRSGRSVAIKIMLPHEARHEDSAKRFTREARAALAINNEHVARVQDVGQLPNGLPYISMELLDGLSLDRTVRKGGPLPVGLAVDYILQCCEGVAAAHARGIIHRDIKPSNLHLTHLPDGTQIVKVLDFGIAKATVKLDPSTDSLSLTETSSTLGSPQYMSPEQLRSSKNVDARTDVWSLGMVLHKLLTGRTAFDADSVGAVFAMITADPPTPLRAQRPDAPAELEAAILGCLARNVLFRFQDVAQFAEALLPFAPPEAQHRPLQIRKILDAAGVSSRYPRSHPSLPQAPSGSWPQMPAGMSSPGSGPGASEHELATAGPTQRWDGREVSGTGRTWDAPPSTVTHPRGAPGWIALVLVLSVVAIGVGSFSIWRSVTTDAESSAATAAPTALAQAPDPPPEPTETDSATEATTAAAEVSTSIRIELRVEPPTATVELDGERTTDNPLVLPRSDEPHELVVSAPGFQTARKSIDASRDDDLEIALVPLARAGSAASASEPTSVATVRPKGPMVDTL